MLGLLFIGVTVSIVLCYFLFKFMDIGGENE